jgi:anthranilate/para-aminobenzoate synthase component II
VVDRDTMRDELIVTPRPTALLITGLAHRMLAHEGQFYPESIASCIGDVMAPHG